MSQNKTLEIHHSNGNASRYPESYADAIRVLKAEYGDDIVTADWEAHTPDSERMLVWADEESAENDDGAKAVAEIIRR